MSAEVTLTEAERAELVSAVSNALRVADGDHAMGTGALAEVAVDRIADWLAARVEQARADERERIAQAIEAEREAVGPDRLMWLVGCRAGLAEAARIAREGGPS